MASFIPSIFTRLLHTTPLSLRTLQQVIRQGPVKRRPKKRNRFLTGKPLIKGIVLETLNIRPRKPNSGQRRCCRVRLSNGLETVAFIPGEGHTLQPTDSVLCKGLRGHRLIGVRLQVVRGKYDCKHVVKKGDSVK